MNANRRAACQKLMDEQGITPKKAYELVKPLKIKGYRNPKKLELKNERKKS